MIPELANNYSWWQVGSVPISLTEYQKSNVCPEFMYIQHRHMVYSELHIFRDLVLDQNVNYNAYATPLLHEALDVDHKIVMLEIGWYHNPFSQIFVQHQHYHEHDSLCLSIFFFTGFFPIFYLRNDYMFTIIIR